MRNSEGLIRGNAKYGSKEPRQLKYEDYVIPFKPGPEKPFCVCDHPWVDHGQPGKCNEPGCWCKKYKPGRI